MVAEKFSTANAIRHAIRYLYDDAMSAKMITVALHLKIALDEADEFLEEHRSTTTSGRALKHNVTSVKY